MIRINFLYFLLVFTSLPVFSQSQDSVKTKRLSLGILLSPELCGRVLNAPKNYAFITSQRNRNEIPKMGVSFGISLKYRLSEGIFLETGLWNSNRGFQTRKLALQWTSQDETYPSKSKTIYTHRFTTIPVKIHYRMLSGKIKIYLSAGVCFDNFSGKRTRLKLYYPDEVKTSKSPSRNLGYAQWSIVPLIGFGFEYTFKPLFSVTLEPMFRYSLTSSTEGGPVKEHLWSVGLNAAIHMAFKRK